MVPRADWTFVDCTIAYAIRIRAAASRQAAGISQWFARMVRQSFAVSRL